MEKGCGKLGNHGYKLMVSNSLDKTINLVVN
jgi:hypothetical protein